MRVLFLGDIVGSPGREIIRELLPGFRGKEKIDFVIANTENAAGGSGITPSIADSLLENGVDVLTTGDHVWKRKEIYSYLDRSKKLIRPANYPKGVPGKGSTIADIGDGRKIAVINLVGRVFMESVDCPFITAREEVRGVSNTTPVIVVDMHAEATSEKIAMGWYLDGLVSAVVGTHTHVQTADEKILPHGTAYITDSGMTGPHDSVIGRKKEAILEHFVTQLPIRFEVADRGVMMTGVLMEFDDKTGKAVSIERVRENL